MFFKESAASTSESFKAASGALTSVFTTSALTVAGCSSAFSVVTAGASVVTTASLFGTAATATSAVVAVLAASAVACVFVVAAVLAASAVACVFVVAAVSTVFVSLAGVKTSASFVFVRLSTSLVASVEVTKSAVVSEFGCVTILSCVSSAETEDVVADNPPTTVASAAEATAIVTHCFLTL